MKKMKKLRLAAVVICFLCFCASYLSAEAGDDIPGELDGTWMWRSAEGDGYFETYIYKFRGGDVLELEEHLPGQKIHKDTGSYESDGRRLIVKITSRAFGFGGYETELPYAHEGGILAVYIEGEVYIFKRQK